MPFYVHQPEFDPPIRMAIVQEVCKRMDLRWEVLQPREGFLLRIGSEQSFFNHQINVCTLNSYSSTAIARDKTYTYILLQRAGVRVPRGDYYFRPGYFHRPDYSINRGINEAIRDGIALGMSWDSDEAGRAVMKGDWRQLRFSLPLIVKPNSLSQGKGVSRVDSGYDLEEAISGALSVPTDLDHAFIVQEYVPGREFRIVMLDTEMLLCYEKRYMSLRGDGEHTIAELVCLKNEELSKRGEKISPVRTDDKKLGHLLTLRALSLNSILPAAEEIVLNDAQANLDAGATAIDVTDRVPQGYIDFAKTIAAQLQLRYLGIDFRCAGLDEAASDAVVLEVNGNPGLTHYFLQGHKESVYSIYTKLFECMLSDSHLRVTNSKKTSIS